MVVMFFIPEYLREVVILVVAVLCVHPALSLYSSPLISTLKVRGSHKMKFPVPDEMMNGTVQIEGLTLDFPLKT